MSEMEASPGILERSIEASVCSDSVAGWVWYCDSHDTHGNADNEDEARAVSDAHHAYYAETFDEDEACSIYVWHRTRSADPVPITNEARGAALRKRRLEAGLSVRELSDRTGMARATVIKAENGTAAPRTFDRLETWFVTTADDELIERGHAIRARRIEMGIRSEGDFADRVGLDRSTIRRAERGRARVGTVEKIELWLRRNGPAESADVEPPAVQDNAPPPVDVAQSPPGTVTLTHTSTSGETLAVTGSAGDLPALRAIFRDLVRPAPREEQ